MLFTRALIPTVKEAPADASNASYALLVRGGFVRKVGAGLYDYLPLGLRVLRKIEAIIRAHMDAAGAHEILMPALLPAEFFQETGRYELYGPTLFRVTDRKNSALHLGPTHEEIVTDIARREIKSWRELPRNLYQIQTKYRDEPRPRGGLLRGREFIMKDAYSFDANEEGARASYEAMRRAYCAIFDELGLTYRMVAADSGAIGGATSAEFQVLADSGEDAIVACEECPYAANLEVATSLAPAAEESPGPLEALRKVSTPGVGSIEDVSAFLKLPRERFLKSLLVVAKGEVVMAVVRGDHELNQVRVARALGVDEASLATAADVEKATGAAVGFAGPVGFKGRVLVDRAAALVVNAAAGANETDHHVTGVNIDRDWRGETHDLRTVKEGDRCPECAAGALRAYRGIEAGHIFILGTKYSEKMGALYSDEKQEKRPLVMGCYGIGVSRLVATAVEQHHDEDGIRWPMAIAPYHVHLVTVGKSEAVLSTAREIYDELAARGVDVLWDDRDERPGVKFKDADLIGLPLRVTVGEKGLHEGCVEVKPRSERDPKKAESVFATDAVSYVLRALREITR